MIETHSFWQPFRVRVEGTEAGLAYLATRITNRKYQLAIAAAPLAAGLLNIGQVQQLNDPVQDCVLRIVFAALFIECVASFYFLTRMVYSQGYLLSGLAQGASEKEPVSFVVPSILINVIEYVCITTGYLGLFWLLWSVI